MIAIKVFGLSGRDCFNGVFDTAARVGRGFGAFLYSTQSGRV